MPVRITGARATELIVEDDRVVGVRVERAGAYMLGRRAHARLLRPLQVAARPFPADDAHGLPARHVGDQLVERDAGRSSVQFGDTVTFDREDGRTQTFRIVGEDEADIKAARIAVTVSPSSFPSARRLRRRMEPP